MKPRISRISVVLTAALSLAFLPNTIYSLETQPPPANDSTQLKVQTPPAKPKSVWMSHEAAEVLKLIRAQVPEDVIMAFIENSRSGFSLSADEIVQLHNEGVTDKMIQAMLARKKVAPPQPMISVAQEPAQQPTPQQQTIVQQPAQVVTQPSVTYVQSEPVYVGAPTTYVYRYPYYSYYDYYPYWGSYWYPGVSFNFGFGHYGGYRYSHFAPSYHYGGHFGGGGFHGGYRRGWGGHHR